MPVNVYKGTLKTRPQLPAGDKLSHLDAGRLIRYLWIGVPDHGINDISEQSLTPSFHALVEEGFDMPETDPGGIGDEEIMWYWDTGQDTCGDEELKTIRIVHNEPGYIVADCVFTTCGHTENYQVVLRYVDGRWGIDDFNGMRAPIEEFVNTWHNKFANGEHRRMIQSSEYSWMSPSERSEYLESVENYLRRYPHGGSGASVQVTEVAIVADGAAEGKVYMAVEKPSEFPGGLEALSKWLGQNLRYPKEAQEEGVQGKVIVKFVINKDGSISDVSVAKGVYLYLDQEAIRVVKCMPKWIPGKNNGVPVRSYYYLPINFKLTE